MTEYASTVDFITADQLGFGLLADGGDLFDLGEAPVSGGAHEAARPLAASSQVPGGGDALADLFASSAEAATEHGAGSHLPYIKLAWLDTSDLAIPAVHGAAAHGEAEPVTVAAAPETAADSAIGTHGIGAHGPALTLDDLLAAAADDLASFHTAAGAAPHHGPLGSGFFTPFNPAELLPGLTEMHVPSPA